MSVLDNANFLYVIVRHPSVDDYFSFSLPILLNLTQRFVEQKETLVLPWWLGLELGLWCLTPLSTLVQ